MSGRTSTKGAFVALALGGAALCGACKGSEVPADRPLRLHAPTACSPGDGAYAQYYARGDFEPTEGDPSAEGRPIGPDGGPFLQLRSDARSMLVDASDAVAVRPFRGLASVPTAGPVDVLLWPFGAPCTLSPRFGARTQTALGLASGRWLLVVGGRGEGGSPASFRVDLADGTAAPLPVGLLSARSSPTVTPFGSGALVAGGRAPEGERPLATAEVYNAATQDFESTPIAIGEARAQHGAVELASGETLLVGGVGETGALLRSLVAVSPSSRRARSQGLAELSIGRGNPVVLRLASGEVLVAGGVDAAGAPIGLLEWLAPDGGPSAKRPLSFVSAPGQTFVALEGGGALAVLSNDGAATGFRNVWIVRADGALEDAEPLERVGAAVRLFPGAQGAPLLWAGDCWLRFQPWLGRFEALADAPAEGPGTAPALGVGSNLASWLRDATDGAALEGLFFDARSPYDGAPTPLALVDTRFLAPDRLVGTAPDASLRFDETGLHLASQASVTVADTTYAAMDLAVDMPTGQPAVLVFRAESGRELVFGSEACPLPTAVSSAPTLTARRSLGVVRGTFDGTAFACTDVLAGERVRVVLRGPADGAPSVARNLRITRREGL